jgi:hypothetical protein
MQDIAPMIVAVTAILTTGGVLLLRPIARKLADYLEAATLEKRKERTMPETARTVELLENLDNRLRLLEDRIAFTESLVSQRGRVLIPTAGDTESEAR